jgi:hypothetical protein
MHSIPNLINQDRTKWRGMSLTYQSFQDRVASCWAAKGHKYVEHGQGNTPEWNND